MERGRPLLTSFKWLSVCAVFSRGQSTLPLPLSHSLTLSSPPVHCCKINGSKSREALPTTRMAPSVLLSISILVRGADSTHSYVPLHQWKAKQQLTAVMRTTISFAHNQVLSLAQITAEHMSSRWRRHSKISPHTCHPSHYAPFTRWYSCEVSVDASNKGKHDVNVFTLKWLLECGRIIGNEEFPSGPTWFGKRKFRDAGNALVDLRFIIFSIQKKTQNRL